MRIQYTVEVNAQPDEVWRVLSDVERWPEWTQSVESVELLDATYLAKGGRARIKQPRMPAMTWQVTELTPGAGFTWVAGGLGIETTGSHTIQPREGGGCSVRLELVQKGLFSNLIEALIRDRSQRYVEMEAQGLKQRCEAAVLA